MSDYEKLKQELLNISTLLEKYPTELKLPVFDILTQAFLKGSILQYNKQLGGEKEPEGNKTDVTEKLNKPIKKSTSKKPSSETYSIDRNLNLRGGSGIPSFKSFFEEKKPSSSSEINALSVYYLKNLMKIGAVTLDQVYTCYKEVHAKPADFFKQSFVDTKNKKGYIEYDESWNLSIPHRGISFIEHDLPKTKPKKSK